MKTRSLISAILSVLAVICYAQDSIKHYKLQALPSAFYTPETSWGLGATFLGFYTPQDTNTHESNAQLFLDFTFRKQISFQGDFAIYTKKNRYFLTGSHDISKFPEFYFGIGNKNNVDDGTLINISYADIKLNGLKKLKNSYYAGFTLHHQTLLSSDHTIVQNGIAIDDMGYATTGIGFTLMIDKRNNMLCPEDGWFFKNTTSQYFDHSHETKGFLSNNLDVRYYKTFKYNFVSNSAFYCVNNIGHTPFRMMPYLGGARYMRGYYAGRFRDNNMTALQTEIRKHAFWRIGFAAFGGFGQVYENVRDFSFNRFHYNYGLGMRFKITKDSPANIRFDIGKTADSYGMYIVFAEAF